METNPQTESQFPPVPTPCLFPIALSGPDEIVRALDALSERVDRSHSPSELLSNCWGAFLDHAEAQFTLVLVAVSLDDLRNEIEVCRRTWAACWTTGRDWKTPAGSYLSPHPLGMTGKVAFVYPGVGSLYPGYSRDVLRIHPQAFDGLPSVSRDELMPMFHADQLWPSGAGPRKIGQGGAGLVSSSDEWPLHKDIVAQAEATVSLAYVWTHLLKDTFQILPQIALGYSLGEVAMFAACGCWNRPQELSARFREWPSFRQRLAGEMAVLRDSDATRHISAQDWLACVAPLPRPAPEFCGATDSSVYVTHINTPREIVVAGATCDVTAWLDRNGVRGQPVPSKLVYHCAAVAPEAATLQTLFELPVAKRPDVDFIGMAPYSRVPHDSKAIARTLVHTALQTVDFPQIVDTAHLPRAVFFVEIGPRNSCSSWIRTILGGREHVCASTDQKGFDAVTSLTRMLAILLAHRVPLSFGGVWNWTRHLIQNDS